MRRFSVKVPLEKEAVPTNEKFEFGRVTHTKKGSLKVNSPRVKRTTLEKVLIYILPTAV